MILQAKFHVGHGALHVYLQICFVQQPVVLPSLSSLCFVHLLSLKSHILFMPFSISKKSAAYLYINGVEVGMSKDSKLPARYDITRFVKKMHLTN